MRKRGAGERKGGKGNVGKSFYSLHTQIPWLRNGSQQIRGCWVEWKLCCSCRDGWLCGPRMLTHVWKNKGMIPCPDHRHPAPSTHTHPPPPAQGVWHTRAHSRPFNRTSICDQSSILATKPDASLSSRIRYLCSIYRSPFKADQSGQGPCHYKLHFPELYF